MSTVLNKNTQWHCYLFAPPWFTPLTPLKTPCTPNTLVKNGVSGRSRQLAELGFQATPVWLSPTPSLPLLLFPSGTFGANTIRGKNVRVSCTQHPEF